MVTEERIRQPEKQQKEIPETIDALEYAVKNLETWTSKLAEAISPILHGGADMPAKPSKGKEMCDMARIIWSNIDTIDRVSDLLQHLYMTQQIG